jgi:2-keto-4-pentenoate hydratase/2-oxohepta-3-ene-1,7-dioic acid hydratase in catechol pathway
VKAVRFVNPEGETRIGALGDDGTITDAGTAGPQGFVPTQLAWDAIAQAGGPRHNVDDVRLLHPVVPNKLIGIGLNYRSHAEESQLDIPNVPVIFAKFSSSLVGPGAEIVIPREETRPDYEGEVAVVIGQGVYRADEAGAPSSRRRFASSHSARASTRSHRSDRASPRRTASISRTSTSARPCRAR